MSFQAAGSSGSELVNSPDISVSLSKVSTAAVKVNYSVTGGTATGGGVDYSLSSGTLTIPAGATSAQIPISIVNDRRDEMNDTIQISLSSPVNGVLGATSVHTYTILDEDPPPTLAFQLSASSVSEAAATANLSLALSSPSDFPVTVVFGLAATGGSATSGVDYSLNPGPYTVAFPPNTTTRSLGAIQIFDDTLTEPSETIEVTISVSNIVNAVFGPNHIHTLTIADDDNMLSVSDVVLQEEHRLLECDIHNQLGDGERE